MHARSESTPAARVNGRPSARYFGRNTRGGLGAAVAVLLLLLIGAALFFAAGGPAWLVAHFVP